jgi:hypothetical protein
LESIQSAFDVLSSQVALLDLDGVIIAVNKAWRDFSEQNGGAGDYVGDNYLEVCRRSASDGSRDAARGLAGLTRVLGGASDEYGLAYQCQERIFRLRARAMVSGSDRQVLVSHEDITEIVNARTTLRRARDGEARLAEELGQRLTAIGLALHVLKQDGMNQQALKTIELALEEARHELRLLRRSRSAEEFGD